MSKKGIAAALAAGLSIAAAPAAAVEDLTGTYRMKLSCKGIGGGEVTKFKVDEPLYIVDLGSGTLRFETGIYGPGMTFLLTEAAKPGNGVLTGMTCTNDVFDLDGLVLRAEVKTKEGKDEATLKGTLLIFDMGSGDSSSCKLTAKRETTTSPKISTCTI